jgi:hypothetical protein
MATAQEKMQGKLINFSIYHFSINSRTILNLFFPGLKKKNKKKNVQGQKGQEIKKVTIQ